MTTALKHPVERKALNQLLIALVRDMLSTITVDPEAPTDTGHLLVTCAVIVGHADQKLMNASKISHFLGMPRTTVLRKLDDLVSRGVVVRHGSVFSLSKEMSERGPVERYVRSFEAAEKALRNSPLRRRP